MKHHYHFNHTILPLEVEIDEEILTYKANIKQQQLPLAQLKYFYFNEPYATAQYELILAYENKKHQLQRLRIYSNLEEKGFLALIDFLKQNYASTDISDRSVEEAYSLLGSKNLSLSVIFSFIWGSTVIVALLLLPLLLHGLESSTPSQIPLDQISQSQHSYIELIDAQAALDFQALVEQNSVLQGNQNQAYQKENPKHTILFPLVSKDWQVHQEIVLIAKFTGDIELIKDKNHWFGIVRNRLWEGIGEQEKKLMLKQNLRLSPQVKIIEIDHTPQQELNIFLLIFGIYGFLSLSVTLYFKFKNQEAQKTKIPLNPNQDREIALDEDLE
jgi:hypothetical protein